MKKITVLFFLFALLISLFAGCGNNADKNIITIKMSDEAKEYEKLLAQSGDKAYFEEGNFDWILQYVADRQEQVLPECEVKNSLDCETLDGSNVYSLTKDGYENIVLYIHGGAWVYEITTAHVRFCDDLASRLNAKVYMPLYPLAPEADSDETFSILEKLYKEILKEGKNVFIMGDSAGGEMSLGLMYTIKEENLTEPYKMVLLAPCADLTLSNKDIEEIDKTDPVLSSYGCRKCAEVWAGEENLTNPKYSAVYADVTGYPDTMIFSGTNDILYPDNCILFQNLKAAGVNVTMVKGEGLWHGFSVFSIPEREESLNIIEEFCMK